MFTVVPGMAESRFSRVSLWVNVGDLALEAIFGSVDFSNGVCDVEGFVWRLEIFFEI